MGRLYAISTIVGAFMARWTMAIFRSGLLHMIFLAGREETWCVLRKSGEVFVLVLARWLIYWMKCCGCWVLPFFLVMLDLSVSVARYYFALRTGYQCLLLVVPQY